MEIEKQKERTWRQYFLNVIHAVRGDEQFTGSSTPDAEAFMGFELFLIIFILIIAIAVCYGAARLSWCYGTFNGDSTTSKVIFSTLCFIFPNFYYPFYALFLNPVCGRTKNQSGGRR
jgi:hypothetical protein